MLGFVALPASAEVKIHDPVVSVLAKPYGIEKRIRLASIDALHFGPDGKSRMVLTLESSGVKEVTLNRPAFRVECGDASGKRETLGELQVGQIVFPVTDGNEVVRRSYVVELRSELSGAEFTRKIREAAGAGRPIRFIGRSDMVVRSDGAEDFSRGGLKLELSGTTRLGRSFKPMWHSSVKKLPACGLKR
ncbi:hypothetical protein [Haloferula helveola]